MATIGPWGRVPGQPESEDPQWNAFRWWACLLAFGCVTGLVASWFVPPQEWITDGLRLGLAVTALLALSAVLVPEAGRRLWCKIVAAVAKEVQRENDSNPPHTG
jgi:hypothetical protein